MCMCVHEYMCVWCVIICVPVYAGMSECVCSKIENERSTLRDSISYCLHCFLRQGFLVGLELIQSPRIAGQ